MKQCTKCLGIFDHTFFNLKNGKPRPRCRQCEHKEFKEWSNKKKFDESYKEKKRLLSKNWRKKNKERSRETVKKCHSLNKDKYKQSWISRYSKNVESLNDAYVRHCLLGKGKRLPIEIPKEMIEAKRIQLQLTRLLKEKRNENTD